jgi:hypothetical protein
MKQYLVAALASVAVFGSEDLEEDESIFELMDDE